MYLNNFHADNAALNISFEFIVALVVFFYNFFNFL